MHMVCVASVIKLSTSANLHRPYQLGGAEFLCKSIANHVCLKCATAYVINFFSFRDSTVQTLTIQPSVQSGRVTYQDSPLVSLNAMSWIMSYIYS